MGINGLGQFLRERNSDLVLEIPLTHFFGERLAIDTSVFFYKFICMDNQIKGQWLDMFINLILWLRKHNIRPLFIFDGPSPPQKQRTQQKRRDIRSRTEEVVLEIDTLLELISDNSEIIADSTILKRIKKIIPDEIEYWSALEIQQELHSRYKKENSKLIRVGAAETQQLQELLTLLGLPWYIAAGEAERTCAWLCKWGYVKGVVSTDSDVLAYGAPIFINDLKVNSETCKLIFYKNVLDTLSFSEDQMRDFCIMCGTDYNDRIRGIGPKTAFSLMHLYHDLEGIEKNCPKIDASNLHFQEGRQMFTLPEQHEVHLVLKNPIVKDRQLRIPSIKNPDRTELVLFLFKHNSSFSLEDIEAFIYHPTFLVS
jgi:5'-3' exonuclease